MTYRLITPDSLPSDHPPLTPPSTRPVQAVDEVQLAIQRRRHRDRIERRIGEIAGFVYLDASRAGHGALDVAWSAVNATVTQLLRSLPHRIDEEIRWKGGRPQPSNLDRIFEPMSLPEAIEDVVASLAGLHDCWSLHDLLYRVADRVRTRLMQIDRETSGGAIR